MTARSRTIRNRLIAAFVVLVALNVALATANELLPSGRIDGEAGSSYVTTPEGSAAWFELLSRTGLQPKRLTTPIENADLDPSSALVIVDVGFTPRPTLESIERFVRSGGHLVVATPIAQEGDVAELLLGELSVSLSQMSDRRFTAVSDGPTTRGVGVVATEGRQSWVLETGGVAPLMDGAGRGLAVTFERGAGSVVVVADPSVFSNRLLATEDNAAFAVAVLDGRQAFFDEYAHGYVDDLVTEPLVPRSWRWTLYLLGVATLIFLVAVGKRLGPPERTSRQLPPPRRWFVESLAATLARTDLGEATDPAREAARGKLAERGGLHPDASLDELVAAGATLGVAASDVLALEQPASDELAAMAIGRVLAAVSQGRRLRNIGHLATPANVPAGSSEETLA